MPELEPNPHGPCPWPLDVTCCPGWPTDPAEWTPQHTLAVEIGTDLLWRRTAGRYGLCPELIRPCRRACLPDHYPIWPPAPRPLTPYQDDQGRWFNVGCGCPRSHCACGPLCVLTLPGPVNAVLEVRVDGQVLPESEYQWRPKPGNPGVAELMRRGGPTGPCWPTCQDITSPVGAPGTFSVLYLRGRAVPAAGQRALGVLACEIYKQCVGASGCRLPERIQTITREGVTYQMFDPGEWLENGLTGLREVDTWLRSVNPHGLTQPSAVFSLDLDPTPDAMRGRWP